MACDIHLFVEKKVEGNWEPQTGFLSDQYVAGNDYFGSDQFKDTVEPLSERNYYLFSALGNEGRNEWGITPVVPFRYLPEDVSFHVRSVSDAFDLVGDGHSHSWATLAELEAYQWGDIVVSGILPLKKWQKLPKQLGIEELKDLDSQGFFHAKVYGDKIRTIDENEAESEDFTSDPEYKHFVRVERVLGLELFCDYFINKFLPMLIERSDSLAHDDVRIVFWFDN